MAVPPGFVCMQWYEPTPRLSGATVEPQIDLVFLTAIAPGEEGETEPYRLGKLTLPRGGVLATSRLLQQQSSLPETDEHSPLRECIVAVKELLLPPGVDPEADMGPAPIGEDGEPIETMQMKYLATMGEVEKSSLENLLQLMDPRMGAAVTDKALGGWLAMLLGPECQELPPKE